MKYQKNEPLKVTDDEGANSCRILFNTD